MSLASILHIFIGATLSGTAVVIALVLGIAQFWVLLGAAAIGFIAALPLSYVIARQLGDQ